MTNSDHVTRQERFYDDREHAHLQALAEDPYAEKLAGELARRAGVGPQSRVLEVGAGFGRFTFPLLEHCAEVVAFDLSPRALEALARTRDEREIPEQRCTTLCGDLTRIEAVDLGESFDFVVGFFLLHHLPDVPAALRSLAPLLRPGGGIAFLEPNRRNPLFLAQVACCPDMTWREESGMFRLGQRAVEKAYRDAGLVETRTDSLGFFPPQVYNRLPASRRLEARLETLRVLRGVLPFLLLTARAADLPPRRS